MMENKEIYNIVFCGTGGQGVLKASEVCGVAVLNQGYRIKKSEVHGMSQRGGSVESHLRFGAQVFSPLIMPGQADFLVCFHAGEAARNREFLKPNGLDFSKFLPQAEKLPDLRFTNTFFLGILAARLPISTDNWFDALEKVVPKKINENKSVFQQGFDLGKDSR